MANERLPASNIQTDQSPWPFWALERFIRGLFTTIFGLGASTVVWRPGVPSSGNAFDTWAEVVAAVAALDGDVTIALDTDTATADIPAGNYDLRPAGVSGPVTIVNGSKNPPFNAPFFTIGPGAVTIKGLTGLDDAQIDNQSTVPVMAITQTGSFTMKQRAEVFQTGAAPLWAITGGSYVLYLEDVSIITPFGGGVAVTVAAPGTLLLSVQDAAAFDVNMLTAAAGTATVSVSEGGRYFTQAGAPTIVPAIRRQAGSSAILVGTGKTAAIPVSLTAASRILVSLKTPSGDALTVKYAALAADRVVGAPGSFKISALDAAGGGSVNGVDVSTIDWEVIDAP